MQDVQYITPNKIECVAMVNPEGTPSWVYAQIFLETLNYLAKHSFSPSQITPYCASFPRLDIQSAPPPSQPHIEAVDASSFEIAQLLVDQGLKPLVLDMANKSSPGGSVLRGARAQEEALCRQSNLYPALKEGEASGYYPIPEFGGLLIGNVTFFRNDNYEFIENPFSVDVFVSAAYDCNPKHFSDGTLKGYDRPHSHEIYELGTKSKMRAMFQAALDNKNDALVLGALGCGAFMNDPQQIAIYYKEVLNEPAFQGVFKKIVFAIKDKRPEILKTFQALSNE